MDTKNEFDDNDDRRDDVQAPGLSAPFSGEYTVVDGVAQRDPAGPGLSRRSTVVPGWMRSRSAFGKTVRAVVGRWWAAFWFQVSMLPMYWKRLARRSPQGFAMTVRAWWLFTRDHEGLENLRAVRSVHAEGARGTVEVLAEQHRWAIVGHLVVNVLAALTVLAAVLVAWLRAPWLLAVAAVLLMLVGLPLLGFIGRDRSVPIIERWISNGVVVPPFDEGLVIQALRDSRIAGIEKAFKDQADRAIRWLVPPVRLASGDGYECVLDLPSGVTVSQAVKAEEAIARGLERSVSMVWLSEVPEEEGGHAGRLRMVVTDTPMRGVTLPPWPLSDPDSGAFDLFQPVPLGINYLGQVVTVTLMFSSMIIGAIPRMGKSFTLRLLVLAAALDPTAELHVYDLKGGTDFKAIGRRVTAAFVASQDEKHSPTVLADLRRMVRDMTRRYETLNGVEENQPERIPEGKITRELANDRALGLHPVVLAIDETQTCFDDWDDAKEYKKLVTKLAKMGPAVGIIVLLATQSVNDDTIPRSISVTAVLRFCLKVTDHIEVGQILGSGAYGKGYKANELSGDDQGLGYLGGEGTETQLVKCFFVKGPEAAEITERAYQLRRAAGRLNDTTIDPVDDVRFVERMAGVWPAGRRRMTYTDLAGLLAAQWPDAFPGWEAEQVSAAGRAAGLEPVQVKRDGVNNWGFRHTDLLALLTPGDQPDTEPDDPDTDLEDDEGG